MALVSRHSLNHVASLEHPSGEGTDVFSNIQMVGGQAEGPV